MIPKLSYWPSIFADAIVITLIMFSVNISVGTLFARKHKYKIDSTQVFQVSQ